MRSLLNVSILAAVVFGMVIPSYSSAEESDLQKNGRSVFEQFGDSVLQIALTIEVEISVGPQNQTSDATIEAMGTVMNESGLLVLSNSAIDLEAQVRQQVRGQVPAEMKVNVDTTVKSARVIMPDGSELDAKVLLQDSDLDLAFVQANPGDAESEENSVFTPAPFDQPAPRLKPLDDILVLGRLGQNLNRVSAITAGKIQSTIRRPRLLYRSDVTALGQPAFDSKGALVGVFLRQTSGAAAGALVIRPVKDVLKIAAQLSEDTADQE